VWPKNKPLPDWMARARAKEPGGTNPKLPRAKPKHREATEQRLFVHRVRIHPGTRDLPSCAIPNGGARSAREAALLKAEGMTAGAPDWMLFCPRGGAAGLALEFKSPTGAGRVSEAQKSFHNRLRQEQWQVHIVKTAEEAWSVLTTYLTGATPDV
jgi:hypothetical protein